MVTSGPEASDVLLGNDVVDLHDPDSVDASRREQFLERAFTPDERLNIQNSSVPDTTLWSCWAGKESAYKALIPRFPATLFAWREYETAIAARTVSTGPHSLALRLEIREGEMVHACTAGRLERGVVVPAPEILAEIRIDICNTKTSAPLPDSQWEKEWRERGAVPTSESALVRLRAIHLLSEELGVDRSRLAVGGIFPGSKGEEDDRSEEIHSPPRVLIDGEPLSMAISLSHHGRFLAVACHPPKVLRKEY